MPPSILIIEDHPLMRNRLVDYFSGTGRWQILGAASNIADARALLQEPADILLLDIQLETGWGLDIIPTLREQFGKKAPAVVVYSGFSDYAHVSAAFNLGVRAYVCKTRNETELEAALETVLRGGIYTDKAVERELKAVTNTASLLTNREAEIFMLVKSGLSNNDIARQLGISRRTVENILSCIYDKTGINSRLKLQKM